MFAPLVRRDWLEKGQLYLRGLLLDGRHKSMKPMAERLGVDHQRLQQFMTSSTWPVAGVRDRLAWRAVAGVRPEVWVVDDTGFPKDGTASPGVARQYSGTLGKVGNCQIGVSVHAASDTASCPLSWRLFLPQSWDGPEAAARRAACRIPDSEHHRPKRQLALEMLDELAATGLRPAALVTDTGYGANADFRHGLEDRGLAYVLQAKGEMTAHGEDAEPHQPAYSGLAPRPLVRLAKARWRIEHDYRELKTCLGLEHRIPSAEARLHLPGPDELAAYERLPAATRRAAAGTPNGGSPGAGEGRRPSVDLNRS
ncbi:IS701 family transposase [Streptomyces sp. 3211.6]|uniref:IS701 family transposase n=1 Tax=Streptomyces sp. 3211.6 TaxID=1938845 RepID=UPI0021C8928F|nr:IS701 family transposase [Streptomyces sp. 3211.6]